MSGETRVQIDARRLRELLANETRLRAMQSDLPSVLAGLRQQSMNDLRSSLAPLEQRQQEFVRGLDKLSGTVREQERRTAERLAQQQHEFEARLADAEEELEAELHASEDRLWDGIAATSNHLVSLIDAEAAERMRQGQQLHALIDAETDARRQLGAELSSRIERERQAREQAIQRLEQDLTALVAQERAERERQIREEAAIRQREINRLENEIRDIQGAERQRVEWANEWIANASHMYETIDRLYPHQRLAPGRLQRMARSLELARQNATLAPQAAVVHAQQAYHELSDFRIELTILEQEWLRWRAAALEEAREVLALARASRNCTAQDQSGQDLDIRLEIDHWTGGELNKLEQEVAALTARIEDPNLAISTEDLKHIAVRRSVELRQRIDAVVDQARQAVISSQLRANIAEVAVEALEAQGYTLQGTTYGDNDHRKGFAAKVQHLNGTEVVIMVEPVPGEPGRNQMRMLTYEVASNVNPALCSLQAREISAALASSGIGYEQPTQGALVAEPRLRDLESASSELGRAAPAVA